MAVERRIYLTLTSLHSVDGQRLRYNGTTVLTKRQSGVARDLRRAAFLAVGEPRRNDEETLASNLHTRDTLVPSLNHLSVTQTECKLWYHTRQHT